MAAPMAVADISNQSRHAAVISFTAVHHLLRESAMFVFMTERALVSEDRAV